MIFEAILKNYQQTMNLTKTARFAIYLCFICFNTAFHPLLHAQDIITLKGRVTDKETRAPLPYVSVDIPHSGSGVITNEFGEFTFHIPTVYASDTVRISLIGYKKIYLKVASIKPDVIQSFKMISEIKELNEVEIIDKKGIPAVDMVKKAIASIRKNYDTEKFQLYGYYRDYIRNQESQEYKNMTEAAVIIEDRGFNKADYQRTKYKLEQIRYNPGFTADSSLNTIYDGKKKYIPSANIEGGNELTILRLHDPVRNHNRKTFSFVDIFDYHFVLNHGFRYESIIYTDSAKIYEIQFGTYRKINFLKENKYWVRGKIYIDSQNFAILKFIYTVTCQMPEYSGKFFDLQLEYKNYKNKYYLNYLSLVNYFEYKDNTTTTGQTNPKQYFQYRELFINKIISKPFESMRHEEAISKDSVLLSNKIPVIEGFWGNYNFINNEKLLE